MFWSGSMTESRLTVPLQLSLSYQHALGDLSPYFAGLAQGQLVASSCGRCSARWLPPRLICTCGSADLTWVTLAGSGTVDWATSTTSALPATRVRGDMVFVLVRFDGATNSALARLVGAASAVRGQRVRLRLAGAADVAHPVQHLEVELV
jgi:uncharacterized OB-fold protein